MVAADGSDEELAVLHPLKLFFCFGLFLVLHGAKKLLGGPLLILKLVVEAMDTVGQIDGERTAQVGSDDDVGAPHLDKGVHLGHIIPVATLHVIDGLTETAGQQRRVAPHADVGQQFADSQSLRSQSVILLETIVVHLLEARLQGVLFCEYRFAIDSQVNRLLCFVVHGGHVVALRHIETLVDATLHAVLCVENHASGASLCLVQSCAVYHLAAYVLPVAVFAAHGIITVAHAEIAQEFGTCLYVLTARPLEGSRRLAGLLHGKLVQ